MGSRNTLSFTFASASVALVVGSVAAQDRNALVAPNGVAFAELKGYERWQMVAPSHSDDAAGCSASREPGCIKSILGNDAMIEAYAAGIPENGAPVPDGAVLAKIEWKKAREEAAGYGMTVPGDLGEVAFMLKDSRRFAETDGWGYATFRYDAATDTWSPFGDGPEFVEACHACHTIVQSRDFVWTRFQKR